MPPDTSNRESDGKLSGDESSSESTGAKDKPEPSINVEAAKEVLPPPVSVGGLPPLADAGVTLVKRVLLMISAFVILAVVWMWVSECGFSNRIDALATPGGTTLNQDNLNSLLKENADFREFWLKIFQMVLLNVLLPVLTALLGYIFGSSKEQSGG